MANCGEPKAPFEAARQPITRLLLAATLLAATQFGMAAAPVRDLPGAKDHPAITRYQGSVLVMSGSAPVTHTKVVFEEKGKPVLRLVDGKIANRYYVAPVGAGPLEVYANYRKALVDDHFDILFACETVQCDKWNTQSLVSHMPEDAAWDDYSRTVAAIFNAGNSPNFYFISARKMVDGGPMYVQVGLVTARNDSDNNIAGRVRQFVQVIEPASIGLGKVSVDAKAIQNGLERDGKYVFYGVLFDTNQAIIRSESGPQIVEMAKALKESPAAKAYVVGHTDNQGDLAANMTLSQKRAQAVVDALTHNYGIAANRLAARGVASLAPVASNREEAGRAKNRRVELVLQ